jgi:hypothetical protein
VWRRDQQQPGAPGRGQGRGGGSQHQRAVAQHLGGAASAPGGRLAGRLSFGNEPPAGGAGGFGGRQPRRGRQPARGGWGGGGGGDEMAAADEDGTGAGFEAEAEEDEMYYADEEMGGGEDGGDGGWYEDADGGNEEGYEGGEGGEEEEVLDEAALEAERAAALAAMPSFGSGGGKAAAAAAPAAAAPAAPAKRAVAFGEIGGWRRGSGQGPRAACGGEGATQHAGARLMHVPSLPPRSLHRRAVAASLAPAVSAGAGAPALVGRCEDMCPAAERAKRQADNQLSVFECVGGDTVNRRTNADLAVKKYQRSGGCRRRRRGAVSGAGA